MKQLFSYYDDGESRYYEGDEFITRRIDNEKSNRLREIEKELDRSLDDDSTVPVMTPLHYALLACAFVIIAIMIYANYAYASLDDAFSKSPLLIGVLALACLAAVVITVIDKKKRLAEPPKENSFDALTKEEEALMNEAFEELGITTDEEGFDVITPTDTDELETLSAVDTRYLTVFTEDDAIVLTDYHVRYELPTSAFKTVEHIERPLVLRDAVKPFFKETRREFGIKETDEGYLIPRYDVFTLETDEGDYTLALPAYDGKILSELLGLS